MLHLLALQGSGHLRRCAGEGCRSVVECVGVWWSVGCFRHVCGGAGGAVQGLGHHPPPAGGRPGVLPQVLFRHPPPPPAPPAPPPPPPGGCPTWWLAPPGAPSSSPSSSTPPPGSSPSSTTGACANDRAVVGVGDGAGDSPGAGARAGAPLLLLFSSPSPHHPRILAGSGLEGGQHAAAAHLLQALELVQVFLEVAATRLAGPAGKWAVVTAVVVLKTCLR